jgi:hypothetical protein
MEKYKHPDRRFKYVLLVSSTGMFYGYVLRVDSG